MRSSFVFSAVLAVAGLSSVSASADMFNPYLFEQMRAPSTRTRAEVRAEMLQEQQRQGSVSAAQKEQKELGQPAAQERNAAAKNVKLESAASARATPGN
jgi:Domain of unknown function (DUF4148)